MNRLISERPEETTRLGSYEIIRKLARGGMAELFLARGPEGVAVVKKILPKYAGNPRYEQLFLDEARLAGSLDHPNIVHVLGTGRDQGEPFFAMEYLHGQDMRSILHRAWTIGEQVPIAQAIHVASAVAAALQYAHEQRRPDGGLMEIVHRDVSPSNVFVSYDGDVKLVDFGVAKAATSSVKTRTGTLKGKISYMSPEQAKGSSIDRRSDIFSLGIVLWEMVTTQRLFRGENDLQTLQLIINQPPRRPSELQPACSAELERVILRALSQDPAARYPTAADFRSDLEAVAEAEALAFEPEALASYVARLFAPEVRSWEEARAAGRTLAEHLVSGGEMTIQLTESDFIEALDLAALEEEEEEDSEFTEIPLRPSDPAFGGWPDEPAPRPSAAELAPAPRPSAAELAPAPRPPTAEPAAPAAWQGAPSGPLPMLRPMTPTPAPGMRVAALTPAPGVPMPGPAALPTLRPMTPTPAPGVRAQTPTPAPGVRMQTPTPGPIPRQPTPHAAMPVVRASTPVMGMPAAPASGPIPVGAIPGTPLPTSQTFAAQSAERSGPLPIARGSGTATPSGPFRAMPPPPEPMLVAAPEHAPMRTPDGALDPVLADRLLRRGMWIGLGVLVAVFVIAIVASVTASEPGRVPARYTPAHAPGGAEQAGGEAASAEAEAEVPAAEAPGADAPSAPAGSGAAEEPAVTAPGAASGMPPAAAGSAAAGSAAPLPPKGAPAVPGRKGKPTGRPRKFDPNSPIPP